MRSTLFSLALISAVAAPAVAQKEASIRFPVPVAAVPVARPTVHRIFTLAWTDITLPASLAEPDGPAAAPSPAHLSRRFVLTWQEAPSAEARTDQAPAGAPAPAGCRTVTLVSLPC